MMLLLMFYTLPLQWVGKHGGKVGYFPPMYAEKAPESVGKKKSASKKGTRGAGGRVSVYIYIYMF